MVKDIPNIIKSTLAVATITLLVKGLGFIEKVLLAYYFGTGPEVDAYLVAFGVIFALFLLVRELIEPGFLRVFMEALSSGDKEGAWRFFNSIGILIFIIISAVVILTIRFPGGLVNLFAPGFWGEKQTLAVELTRLAFPTALFLCLSALTYITLNGLKQFALPAAGDIFFKGGIILGLILLYDRVGIFSLVRGMVFGAMARLFVHLSYLWRRVSIRKSNFSSHYLKAMRHLTWPILIGVSFSQISALVDLAFASYLVDGSIAALAYAKKIVDLPVLLFPYVLSIVVFPYFSQLAIEKNRTELTKLLSQSLRWITFIFLPLSVFVLILATPIVQILFQRGGFDAASTQLTSGPLAFYALGMIAFAIETIIVQFYFACADTRTPIAVGVICVILNIVLTFILIKWMNHLGIALALVVSKSLKVLVLLGLVKEKIEVDWPTTKRFVSKISLATAVTGAGMYIIHMNMGGIFPASLLKRLFYLIFCFVAGGFLYLLAGYSLGVGHEIRI